MVSPQKPKKTIGRAEPLKFPGVTEEQVFGRIDSGARTSAIWVSYAKVEDDRLAVIFFGPESPLYDGKKHYFTGFDQDIITSSNGQRELRYKIKLVVILKGRRVRAGFTLADRSTQVYPVLIGRNVLRGKFIVDVSLGKPLAKEEKELLNRNQQELSQEKI